MLQLHFKRVVSLLGVHKLVFVAALILSVLVSYPVLIFPHLAGDSYRDINIAHFGSDEHYYLLRGNEVLHGNPLGSTVLRENKDGTDFTFSSVEQILLSPLRWLGLSDSVTVVGAYNLYNFIGVFVLLLLLYSLVFQLSGDVLLSTAASLFVVGGYSIIYNKTLFYTDFNIYGRMVYPVVSSLPFFGYLNALVVSLKFPSPRKVIGAGLLLGLLFYVYFFAWSFALALTTLLFVLYLFKKNWGTAKNIFYILLIGGALGSYLVWEILSLPSEFAHRMYFVSWALHSYRVVWSSVGFVALLLFFLYRWKAGKGDRNLPFILALILTPWVALNQQIITGRLVQYGHYYWYFIVPTAIIAALYMLWRLIPNQRHRRYFLIFLLAVLFINTAVGQYRSTFTTLPEKLYEQNYRPLLDVLNTEPRGVVLASDERDSSLVAIYTRHDLFWLDQAFSSTVPVERAKEALFVYLYVNKNARPDPFLFFADTLQKGEENMYTDLYRLIEGYSSGLDYYVYRDKDKKNDPDLLRLREDILSKLSVEYKTLVGDSERVRSLLRKYGVGFVIWDINKHPEWDISFLGDLQLLAEQNGVYLFRVDL